MQPRGSRGPERFPTPVARPLPQLMLSPVIPETQTWSTAK
jgi:hypothetical protein